jgi:hypothetical protein
MVFDTESRTLDSIITAVKAGLMERDGLNTEEARNNLKRLSLAARIKETLLTDPSFFIPTLDVYSDKNTIVLRGIIHNPGEHKRIEETARKIAADTPLKCELHYRR